MDLVNFIVNKLNMSTIIKWSIQKSSNNVLACCAILIAVSLMLLAILEKSSEFHSSICDIDFSFFCDSPKKSSDPIAVALLYWLNFCLSYSLVSSVPNNWSELILLAFLYLSQSTLLLSSYL